GYSSLRFRPVRTLSSAVENLRACKVVGVIDKVQIVQDPATGGTFILKSLRKSHVETRERQTIIPHGVPFMVKLLCYYVSEDSIFLHLEHVQVLCMDFSFPGEVNKSWLRCQHVGLPLCLNGPCLQPGDQGCFLPHHVFSLLSRGDAVVSPPLQVLCPAGLCPFKHQSSPEGPWQRFAPSSSIKARGPDTAVQDSSRGASLACGQLREQPLSGQGQFLASHGHSQRAWAVKEEQVQLWAAEILLALEGLHQQGVLCRDLNPRNLLLDAAGHVRLTFFGQWTEIEPQCCSQAQEELYSAPEVGSILEPTEAADCWSFGSLLYELLTGVPLSQNHPSGIQPHTPLHLPEGLSTAAKSLLTELLQYNPKQRLGSGESGMTKLKSHAFFSTIPWNKLV
ncbi:Ribosomal protein S6 kinase-like 1, partial [Chaetura pelagica]